MRSLHSLLALFLFIPALVTAQNNSPRQVADELLAADRAFAAASAKTALVTALSALFAGEVAMPAPNGIAYGSQKAIEALKANPANIGAKAEWVPARARLQADAGQGRGAVDGRRLRAAETDCSCKG